MTPDQITSMSKPDCEHGDCPDHYGDPAAWCNKCRVARLRSDGVSDRYCDELESASSATKGHAVLRLLREEEK